MSGERAQPASAESTRGRGVAAVLARLTGWSARHPWRALAVAFVALVVGIIGIARMRVSPFLGDMFGGDEPAAAALARITRDYHALDELFVVATLPVGRDQDPALLEQFARRFEAAVSADARAAAMSAGVRYRHDPAWREYFETVVIPAGAYYLDDEAFEEFLRRLTPAGMREQLERGEALVSAPGPEAGAAAKAVLRDPLRLSELIERNPAFAALPRAGGAGGNGGAGKNDLELSRDGRSLLIRVAGRSRIDDLEFSRAFSDRIGEIARSVNAGMAPQLEVEIGGGYAIASVTSRGMRRDSIFSVLVSVALLHGLFFVLYRRPGAPLLIVGVAAAGIAFGFGVRGLFAPTITPLSAVIAALLAGLGIDYGIHFLSHYQAHRAPPHSMPSMRASVAATVSVGAAIVANCLTSTSGFVSLWPSSVRMLSDFALLGAFGLLGAMGMLFVAMPALLALVDGRRARRAGRSGADGQQAAERPPRFMFIADVVARRPSAAMALAICVPIFAVLAIALRGPFPPLESDTSVLHPKPNQPLEVTDSLPERFIGEGEMLTVEIRADSGGELLSLAHAVDERLMAAKPKHTGARATGTLGIHTLLPDPETSARRIERLRAVDGEEVARRFEEAVSASAFAPDAFGDYGELLRSLVTARPPGLEELARFPSLARQFLPSPEASAGAETASLAEARSTIVLVRLPERLRDETLGRGPTIGGLRDRLSGFPPGRVTLTGMEVVSHDLDVQTTVGLPRSLGLALVLVVACLWLILRRLSDVALSLIPLAFAVLGTLGAMLVLGHRVSAVSGVALPLLAGIAVDAGLILVAIARIHAGDAAALRHALRASTHAVLAATATTATGFGALMFTSTPAVRSLGLFAAIGVACSYIGAVCLLLPVLMRRAASEPVTESPLNAAP